MPDGTSAWGGRPVARTVADVEPRCKASLLGVVRSTAVRRRPELPGTVGGVVVARDAGTALDAQLDDGTGAIVLRWLGRSVIPGVASGAWLAVEGTVHTDGGQLLLLNPLYRFEPAPDGSAPFEP